MAVLSAGRRYQRAVAIFFTHQILVLFLDSCGPGILLIIICYHFLVSTSNGFSRLCFISSSHLLEKAKRRAKPRYHEKSLPQPAPAHWDLANDTSILPGEQQTAANFQRFLNRQTHLQNNILEMALRSTSWSLCGEWFRVIKYSRRWDRRWKITRINWIHFLLWKRKQTPLVIRAHCLQEETINSVNLFPEKDILWCSALCCNST